jgi:TonB family protein
MKYIIFIAITLLLLGALSNLELVKKYRAESTQTAVFRATPKFGKAYAVKIQESYYSYELRAAGIEGYVITEHSVDEEGRVGGVKVIEEQPVEIFTEEAIKAVKKLSINQQYRVGKKSGLKNIRQNGLLN